MTFKLDRRQFVRLAGYGGIVAASSLSGFSRWAQAAPAKDFYFVQLSDTHWGFSGPAVNPDAAGTLRKAVAAVNALHDQPDFVVFTGDLTHTTDDPAERRKRLGEFKAIVGELKVPQVRFMPGEHDASLDHGEAYREFFGDTHYTFDHRGVHFIALDNVSDPAAMLGDDQLGWLARDLQGRDKKAPIVVLAHRPLFDLAPAWDWATRDGARAIDLLMPFESVTVFYGHIHQENHHLTGHIPHHAAKGLMFALPAPQSVPKKAPIPWDPARPYQGLGFREVEDRGDALAVTEFPVT
jgi:3',5'-cyclic AMP phosphodiesterase CpdA